MNIIKKEYIYEINPRNQEGVFSLNNSYGGRGGGGVSYPGSMCGFSFSILLERRDKGVVILHTFNEENFPFVLAKLFQITVAELGEPLKTAE